MANRAALERFLRARAGDAGLAEDLIQELWLKLDGVTGEIIEPLSYLYRMADNLVLDRRRSARRRERRDWAWNDLSVDVGGTSDAPPADRELIAREQLRAVEQMISKLGERTAHIFRRYRIEGIGQRMIAAEQGISISAVEKHLQKAYRAIVQVRETFDAELPVSERLVCIAGENDVDD